MYLNNIFINLDILIVLYLLFIFFQIIGRRTPHFLFEQTGKIMHIVVPDHIADFRNIVLMEREQLFGLFDPIIDNVFQRRAVHSVFEYRAEPAGRYAVLQHDLVQIDLFRIVMHRIIDKLRHVIDAVGSGALGTFQII